MQDHHAYLIACHNNEYILMKLCSLLDDERNDIYIHVDKRWEDFDKQRIVAHVSKAKIIFIKRRCINWGGFSQIKNMLTLLDEAVKTEHSYYHFISGVDMPLKTQEYIHNFFKENNKKEFIVVDSGSNLNEVNFDRIKYYYPLQEVIGRFDHGIYKYLRICHNLFLNVQKKLGVNRIKTIGDRIYKGSQWFSITHEFAKYILENKKYIKKHFSLSVCADELIVQTLVMNSPFKENIAQIQTRHIDWKRGSPYTFKACDLDELIKTDKLFARKFDESVDLEIVEGLYEYISQQS